MKRDMELIRAIMLRIEDRNEVSDVPPPEGEQQNIGYHLWLMLDAGLISGLDLRQEHDTGEYLWYLTPPPRLTWSGHEFLDAARNDTVWKTAKSRVGSVLGTVSFAVFTQVLIDTAKQQLGLKP